MRSSLSSVARGLREIGRDFHARGWVLGTSGNFSVVLSRDPLELAITASAVSKGDIRAGDVLTIGADGGATGKPGRRPSAEALLHLVIARQRGAAAVLHTHSVWSTILSELHAAEGGLTLSSFEMLKGLEGVRTHQHAEWVPILENDQEMPRLAVRVDLALQESPAAHGFLLRGHGLYTWGDDLTQARRHVEIFEFLLETVGRMQDRTVPGAGGSHGTRKNR
jgi:methylthioribulose-1-phosphate dehydratase